jgi:hypothetical protein
MGAKTNTYEPEQSPPSGHEIKNVELYLHSPIRLHAAVLGCTVIFLITQGKQEMHSNINLEIS